MCFSDPRHLFLQCFNEKKEDTFLRTLNSQARSMQAGIYIALLSLVCLESFLTDEAGSKMLYGIVFNQRLVLQLQTDSILQFQIDTDQPQP